MHTVLTKSGTPYLKNGLCVQGLTGLENLTIPTQYRSSNTAQTVKLNLLSEKTILTGSIESLSRSAATSPASNKKIH